jgi:Ni,Fe-hydrogenase III large subunit
MQVRIEEVRESVRMVLEILATLPHGPCCAPPFPIPEGKCALGAVEGWRGEIIHWIRTGPDGSIERCKIKDPSVNNWPALVEAVQGNIIADFPVINKSFNLSYSGTDR